MSYATSAVDVDAAVALAAVVLRLDPDAPLSAIRAARRALARRTHPDVGGLVADFNRVVAAAELLEARAGALPAVVLARLARRVLAAGPVSDRMHTGACHPGVGAHQRRVAGVLPDDAEALTALAGRARTARTGAPTPAPAGPGSTRGQRLDLLA